MKEKTIFELVSRLNEIMIETNKLELEQNRLEKAYEKLNDEWNDIVYELWDRIPSLQEDQTIQPKTKIRR